MGHEHEDPELGAEDSVLSDSRLSKEGRRPSSAPLNPSAQREPLHSPSLPTTNTPNARSQSNIPPLDPLDVIPTSLSTRQARQILTTWPSEPTNPYNWSRSKRMLMTITLSVSAFIVTAGSSIGVPGMHVVMQEFGETNAKIGVLISSAYVVGLGTGPFLFAPISELYGRQTAYVISQLIFVFFFLGNAFCKNMAGFLIMRFFCGIFGSVTPTLGVATVADIFSPQQRGTPISLYALGPMAGPVLGNMLGYWLLFLYWRWTYYIWTMVAAVNFVAMCLVMRETYAPVLQKKLVYSLTRKIAPPATGIWKHLPDLSWMSAMVTKEEAMATYTRAFSRPPRLLLTNPVALGFSIYYAYTYGLIYLYIVGLPLLYGKPPYSVPGLFSYEWPLGTIGLGYLSLGLGFVTAGIFSWQFQNRIYGYLSKLNGDKGQPEYRLVITQIGMICMPIGFFIWGWTAEAQTHWMGPCMGQAIAGIGLMLAFNSLQTFFVDAFYPYSAAAIAGATACRSVTACIIPIFTSDMFKRLGWGWSGTLLACIALLGNPGPIIMFYKGQRLRERFEFQG
ncbi:hypothetical protein IAT38_000829 [Cryptococcus sp. DSM 104549]